MSQSKEEQIRVCVDWENHFAPVDYIKNESNADIIVGYIEKYFSNVYTVSNLTIAEQKLRAAGVLQLVPPKTAAQIKAEAEQAQVEAIAEQSERWKKQHYDALAQKPRDFSTEARAKAEADARIKEQAQAEKDIEAEINRYTCNHPRLAGVLDYARTEQFRKDLRKIEVRKNGKRDAVLTLKTVREAISNLPG